jgi:hypothetical protein
MTGLNQVRDAVLQILQAAGLTAVAAWDGAAKRYEGAVAAVDVAEASGKPAAIGGYLGQVYDAETDTVAERYGRTLEVVLSIDVRAPTAALCETGCETAAEALLSGGLPSGLRLGEQSWEGVAWDRATQMFLRKGRAVGRAFFTATAEEDSGPLLDFILKGVRT